MGNSHYLLALDGAGKVTAVAPDGAERSRQAELDANGQKLLKRLLDELSAGTIDGDGLRDLGGLLHEFLLGDHLGAHLEIAWHGRDKSRPLPIQLHLNDSHRLGGFRT